jgi:hypothetical protein
MTRPERVIWSASVATVDAAQSRAAQRATCSRSRGAQDGDRLSTTKQASSGTSPGAYGSKAREKESCVAFIQAG